MVKAMLFLSLRRCRHDSCLHYATGPTGHILYFIAGGRQEKNQPRERSSLEGLSGLYEASFDMSIFTFED